MQTFKTTVVLSKQFKFADLGWGLEESILLAKCLRCSIHLKSLDLFSNRLCDAAMDEISKALPATLEYINVFFNNIGSLGAAHLAEALPRLRSMAVLRLGYN